MIELNKEDIEAIATQRYAWGKRRQYLGVVFGLIAAMVIIALTIPDAAPLSLKMIAISPPAVAILTWFYFYLRRQDRAVKDFVSQCESDPELLFTDGNEKYQDWINAEHD